MGDVIKVYKIYYVNLKLSPFKHYYTERKIIFITAISEENALEEFYKIETTQKNSFVELICEQ